MKKRILSALLIVVLCVSLAACGEKTEAPKSAGLTAVMETLGVTYDLSHMMELTDIDLMDLYGIDTTLTKQYAARIASSGIDADEIILLEANDKAAFDTLKEKITNRYNQKLNEAKDYLPDEYTKITACPVIENGLYIALIVSDDYEAMAKLYNEAFK